MNEHQLVQQSMGAVFDSKHMNLQLNERLPLSKQYNR